MTDNIINKFVDAEILLDESAYKKIKNYNDSAYLVDSLIKHMTTSSPEMMVLTGKVVEDYLERTSPDILKTTYHNDSKSQMKVVPQDYDYQILKDASNKSYTNGEIRDLSSYFRSRYHKLRDLLTYKRELKDSTSIKEAMSRDDVVNIVGMVNDIRYTKNNHIYSIYSSNQHINYVFHNSLT